MVNYSLLTQTHRHKHTHSRSHSLGCVGGAHCVSCQCEAVWGVMEGRGLLMLFSFSLLISCLFYHSLTHQITTENVMRITLLFTLSASHFHIFFSSPFECFTSSSLQVLLKKCFVFVLSLLFAFSVRR